MIYLDNASTTPTRPEVVEAMFPYFTSSYGNPSSLYSLASDARRAVDGARTTIASLIGAQAAEEVYFTSGGSEADNWALVATAESYKRKGRHIITTKIEHHAVLRTCEYLEKQGADVTYLPVDERGLVDLEELRRAIRPDTVLVSVMFANNEIGTIESVSEIGKVAKEHGVLFHTDAVQAFGQLPIDVGAMNIDMLSSSAHKIRGPKGIGFLYIRKGVKIGSLIRGGQQERGRRAGTENVPAIVGYGKAAEIAGSTMRERTLKEKRLRDRLVGRVLSEIPDSYLNGHSEERLPGNASFCFRGVEGELLLRMLDEEGICASSGSACASGSLDPSHVLLALGRSHELALGSLRLTLSDENTEEEIDHTVDVLKARIAELRGGFPR